MQVGVLIGYFIEFIQLLLFIIRPIWDWNLDFDNVFWRWFQRFQLGNPITAVGYEVSDRPLSQQALPLFVAAAAAAFGIQLRGDIPSRFYAPRHGERPVLCECFFFAVLSSRHGQVP